VLFRSLTGTAVTILDVLNERDVIKGEIVLVIEPEEDSGTEFDLEEIVRDLMEEGLSGKKLANEAGRRFGVKKTDAYNIYLQISGRGREP